MGKAVAKRIEVLLGEQCGGDQHGNLLAPLYRDERCTHGDFSFAESDVAAYQAVHSSYRRHVGDGRIDGFGLVGGDLKGKLPSEFLVVVLAECKAM